MSQMTLERTNNTKDKDDTDPVYTKKAIISEWMKNGIDIKQFHLDFQGRIQTKTGDILGIDAQFYLEDENTTRIDHIDFIESMDCNHNHNHLALLIISLMLEKTCQKSAEWQKKKLSHKMILKIPLSVVTNPLFFDIFKQTIKEKKVNFEEFVIQIKYESFINDHNETLKKLSDLGSFIALQGNDLIDLSLDELSELEVTYIKINHGVFSKSRHHRESLRIKTFIERVKLLGKTCFATDVETVEEATFLERAGCLHQQGEYFLPAGKEFPSWEW